MATTQVYLPKRAAIFVPVWKVKAHMSQSQSLTTNTVKFSRLTLASILFIPLGLFSIWASLFQLLPDHAVDETWPAHARFHVSWAAGKLFALGVNQILLAVIPFRSGQKWSWFALASNFVFGALSIVPSSRIHMGPLGPFKLQDTSTKLILLSWLSTFIGLIVGYKSMFRSSVPIPPGFQRR